MEEFLKKLYDNHPFKRVEKMLTGRDALVLNAENKDMGAGLEHTRKLLESGEFEMGPTGLRRIPK